MYIMVYIDGVLLIITKPIVVRLVKLSAKYCGTNSSLSFFKLMAPCIIIQY